MQNEMLSELTCFSLYFWWNYKARKPTAHVSAYSNITVNDNTGLDEKFGCSSDSMCDQSNRICVDRVSQFIHDVQTLFSTMFHNLFLMKIVFFDNYLITVCLSHVQSTGLNDLFFKFIQSCLNEIKFHVSVWFQSNIGICCLHSYRFSSIGTYRLRKQLHPRGMLETP